MGDWLGQTAYSPQVLNAPSKSNRLALNGKLTISQGFPEQNGTFQLHAALHMKVSFGSSGPPKGGCANLLYHM